MEEQAAAFLVDGHVAEFIDDDQPRLADGGEFVVEPVVVLGAAKAHEQVAGGEEAHRDVVRAARRPMATARWVLPHPTLP